MKISLFMVVQGLGWLSCLIMAWTAQHIYFTKDDLLGGLFCLLLGILFTLILIHLLLFRWYAEQHKTRQGEAMLRAYKEKDTQAIQKRD